MERRKCQEDRSAVSSAPQPPCNPPKGGEQPVSKENQRLREGRAVAAIAVIAIGRVGTEVLSALSGKLLYLTRSIAIGTDPVALLHTKADEKLIFTACSFSNCFRRDFEAALYGIDVAFVVADAGRSTNNKLISIVADTLRARSIPVITAVVPPIHINGERRKKTESDNLGPLRDVSNAAFPIANVPRLPARLPRQQADIPALSALR
jgi:cell division GTPase FtsZ